jgi:type II secretory pathway pseudopilin PulG
MTIPADKLRTRLSDERGFGLVETLVAFLVLVTGMIAAFQLFDAATRNTYRAEQSQVAINVAQREIEEIRNLDYDEVAMSTTPVFNSDTADPRHRVSGTRFDADNDGSLSEMVRNGSTLDGGGQIDCGGANAPCLVSGPENFTSGDVSGQIFRFVVWRNDPTCSTAVCAGSQDLKRAIVVVKLDEVAASFQRNYVEVQSDFVDPDATLTSDLPGGQEVNVPQQFWLTDTTCDNDERQPIVTSDPAPEGHALHNTLGACQTGLRTGPTAGAPDLLDVEPPPDDTPTDPNDPPIVDYATDLEPSSGPDDDEGLQITRQASDGCAYSGGPGSSPWQSVHRWATPPIGIFPVTSFAMTGSASIVLYLRSLAGAQHSGRICTYLYRRTLELSGVATDVLIDADSFSISQWPTSWTQWTRNLTFPQTTVSASQRLVLAISIDRNGTPADTVQILYDHPDWQSRLEVITSTPLSE